jgi:hypothetical protein
MTQTIVLNAGGQIYAGPAIETTSEGVSFTLEMTGTLSRRFASAGAGSVIFASVENFENGEAWSE